MELRLLQTSRDTWLLGCSQPWPSPEETEQLFPGTCKAKPINDEAAGLASHSGHCLLIGFSNKACSISIKMILAAHWTMFLCWRVSLHEWQMYVPSFLVRDMIWTYQFIYSLIKHFPEGCYVQSSVLSLPAQVTKSSVLIRTVSNGHTFSFWYIKTIVVKPNYGATLPQTLWL